MVMPNREVLSAQFIFKLSSLPSWIAILVGGCASVLFYLRGEADVYAPLMLGSGLALLWGRRHSSWLSTSGRWVYIFIFSLFIWERSMRHAVFFQGDWLMLERSFGLMICGVMIYLVGGAAWLMDWMNRAPPQDQQRFDSKSEKETHHEEHSTSNQSDS